MRGWVLQSFKREKEKVTAQDLLIPVIFGLLVIVRCLAFGKIPGGFNQDGALAAVDALALARHGTDHLGTVLPAHFEAWGSAQMSVLLSYLMVPFFWIGGMNSITARLPILLLSIAGSAALYGLAKYLFNKKTAAVVLLFLAVNPWHFMQSRWALDCNLFPRLFLIGLYFLVTGIEKTKRIYLSMFFFSLCLYAYGVAFFMVPVFLLLACAILYYYKKVNLKHVVISGFIHILIAWPIYTTMLINFMKWETVKLPFVTMQFFSDSVRSSDILFFTDTPIKQLFSNMKALINVVFLQKPDLPWNAINNFGTMYLWSMPFILLGIGVTINQSRKATERKLRIGLRLLLAYYFCSIIMGICINYVNINRINIIFYAHIMFAGVGIAFIIKKFKWISACFLLFYGVGSMMFFTDYFTTWSIDIRQYFYVDFLEAVDYAEGYECDYYYITPDTQYQGSWNVSEVLTLYEMEIDALYFQGKTDELFGADIPYTERYRYRNPLEGEVRTDEDIGYVLRIEEMDRFPQTMFMVKEFGDYFVAISLR